MTTCYPMETEIKNGQRFIPVRENADGERWLQTLFVADTAADCLEAARLSDLREMGAEWAAACRLVGVAEVQLRIVTMHLLGQGG